MAKVQKDDHYNSSEASSSNEESTNVSQSHEKPKKAYTKIPNELRNELIHAVENDNERIKQAAQRLGINYSSAKTIIQIYRNEGRSYKKFKTKKADRELANNQDKAASSIEFEDKVRKQHKANSRTTEKSNCFAKQPETSIMSVAETRDKLITPRLGSGTSTDFTNNQYYQNDYVSTGDNYEQTYEFTPYESDSNQSNYYDVAPPNTINNAPYTIEKSFITYEAEPVNQAAKNFNKTQEQKSNSSKSTSSQSQNFVQDQSQQVNNQKVQNQFNNTYQQPTSVQNYNQTQQFNNNSNTKTNNNYIAQPINAVPQFVYNNNNNANNNTQQVNNNANNNNNNNNYVQNQVPNQNTNINSNNGTTPMMTPYYINMNQYNPSQPQQIFIINQDQNQPRQQMNPQQFQQFISSPTAMPFNPQGQQFIMQQTQSPQPNFQPQQFIPYQDQNQNQNINQNQNNVQDNNQNQQYMVQNMQPSYYQPQYCPMPAPIIYIMEGDFKPAQNQGGSMNYQNK